MPNVTEINLDGAGDIDFSAQMGSGSNNTLAVNASDMTKETFQAWRFIPKLSPPIWVRAMIPFKLPLTRPEAW